MFHLNSKISIKTLKGVSLSFPYAMEVSIHTSIDSLTDTCRLTLPRKYALRGKEESDLTRIINRNDRIEVQLGYDDTLSTLFTGYIKSVSTGHPVVIECENESWLLKQIKLKPKQYDQVNLMQWVYEYLPQYKPIVEPLSLGEMRITGGTTLAKKLDEIKSRYPVCFFFRDGVFYGIQDANWEIASAITQSHSFKFGYNIVGDSLKYIPASEIHIQVVAKTITKDNTELEWKEPQEGTGEIRTIYLQGAKNLLELQACAKMMLVYYKCNKMAGSFTALGSPLVKKGDSVHLYDDENKERNNRQFRVTGVDYSFGKGGFRQQIILGNEVKI